MPDRPNVAPTRGTPPITVALPAVALISGAGGYLVLGAGAGATALSSGEPGLVGGLLSMALGLVLATIALGLWRGWRLARVFTILYAAVGVVRGLSEVTEDRPTAVGAGLFLAVVHAAVIYSLLRPSAHAWFRRATQIGPQFP